jgi:chaperone required for assembly of F1-ATPase
MRDIFTAIFENQPLDPMEAARRGARPKLRKRFYKHAQADGDGAVLLDRKPVRTPARRTLAAPTPALAEQLAAEWNAQTDVINPAHMPLTRLANAVIDAVSDAPQPIVEEIAKYLGSDLLCYRAESPAGLVERQTQAWDSVLAWTGEAFGVRFVVTQGVVHVPQPDKAIAAARAAIPMDVWRLAAVSSITALTGSALLALALANNALDADTAWAAAHLDEDWQMSQWGRDELALERRAYRYAEFQAAVTILRLTN